MLLIFFQTKFFFTNLLYFVSSVKCLRFCLGLGSDHQDACVLCAQVFRPGDAVQPIRCATPGCAGIYCEVCFADLNNTCTICMDPIEYGDLSDVDVEQ